MPAYYSSERRIFQLDGGDVSYVIYVDEVGQLMHLYWGKRIPPFSIETDMRCYPEGSSTETHALRLPWEVPTLGGGWYGTPAIEARNSHGDNFSVLRYVSHRIYPGKHPLSGLPATYCESDDECDSLEIVLLDSLTGMEVTLQYTIFNESGAISRSMLITNTGENPLELRHVMSASVLLHGNKYDLIHLKGAHLKECQVMRRSVGECENRVFSQRGASSNEANPSIFLCDHNADERMGRVWAMNFVYSGSFLATASVDNNENTRLQIGMNPETFSWLLSAGETFQSPEAVLVYSDSGINGMSQIYHKLYRTRLARGQWRDKVRPVLANNWEATFFDFNEEKLLQIATKAKEIGYELFVLDDGWFGKRNIDNCSLGDWVVNREKLPHGLDGLAKKVNEMGLKFGLWFEPEMVSPDSDLYRAHPDWCLHVDGRDRTEARHQLILDLSREDVQQYVIDAVSKVLSSANIEYVKWDMNRNMSEYGSALLKPERMKEVQHRYILGLYHVLETVTSRFPYVLFESCASGGGRYDGGMLYYMPQAWTSDDTDPTERLYIQYGTSFVYPPSAIETHISRPRSYERGRYSSMEYRANVGLGWNLGTEFDLSKISPEDEETMKKAIAQQKEFRHFTFDSVFSRLSSPFESSFTAWQFLAKDGSQLLVGIFQSFDRPRTPPARIRLTGLDPDAAYIDQNGNSYSGAQLMNVGIWSTLMWDSQSQMVHLRKE